MIDIEKISRLSGYVGGCVLIGLALLMTVSIIGGGISKIAYSQTFIFFFPVVATILQDTGIRTLSAIYDIMEVGIAFVIFSFLPAASVYKGHAVIEIGIQALPNKVKQGLIAIWDSLFFILMLLITWRLFYGMERLMTAHDILIELNIPRWWGYALAVCQMSLASLVSGYVTLISWRTFVQR